MAKKQLAINLISNSVAFAVQFGINFFFTPYLIRTVGKEAYSFFPLANSFVSYTSIITIALNSMATRFITIKIQQNDNEGANRYFNSVLIGNTYIALFITALSLVFVVFANKFINIPSSLLFEIQLLFGLVFLSSIIGIATSVYGVAFFAKNQMQLSSLRNMQANFGRIAILFLLFYFFKPSIFYFGVANLAVTIFVVLTNKRVTRNLLPQIRINKSYFDKTVIFELLKSGIWNSINQLSLILITNLDLLICNLLLGVSQTGDFALVKTIPIFIQSVVGMLVSVFVPEFVILYAQNRRKELLISISRSMKFMSLILSVPLGFMLVFGYDFFRFWVPSVDTHKLFLLSNLTIIPLIITTSINTIFNIYTVVNKLKTPALVLLSFGILNTSAIFIVLKTTNLGLYAIPLVGLITGLIQHLLFTPIYSAHCLNVKWSTFYRPILRGLICCTVVVCISLVVKSIVHINNWSSLLFSIIVVGIIALAINTIMIFDKREKSVIFIAVKNKFISTFNKSI